MLTFTHVPTPETDTAWESTLVLTLTSSLTLGHSYLASLVENVEARWQELLLRSVQNPKEHYMT